MKKQLTYADKQAMIESYTNGNILMFKADLKACSRNDRFGVLTLLKEYADQKTISETQLWNVIGWCVLGEYN